MRKPNWCARGVIGHQLMEREALLASSTCPSESVTGAGRGIFVFVVLVLWLSAPPVPGSRRGLRPDSRRRLGPGSRRGLGPGSSGSGARERAEAAASFGGERAQKIGLVNNHIALLGTTETQKPDIEV
ncbi:unnamed protein product [Lampetra fluviatilis]